MLEGMINNRKIAGSKATVCFEQIKMGCTGLLILLGKLDSQVRCRKCDTALLSVQEPGSQHT